MIVLMLMTYNVVQCVMVQIKFVMVHNDVITLA